MATRVDRYVSDILAAINGMNLPDEVKSVAAAAVRQGLAHLALERVAVAGESENNDDFFADLLESWSESESVSTDTGRSTTGQPTLYFLANDTSLGDWLATTVSGADSEGIIDHNLSPPRLPSQAATSPRYIARALLGLGGMSEVWRAWDARLKRHVALKVLRPELMTKPTAVARFKLEASVTSRLQHPGVTSVYDVGVAEDARPYFVMSEIRGSTLAQVIRSFHEQSEGSSSWTLWKVIDVLARACEAIAFAHQQAVLHRDVKPENIMVGPFGEVIVLDWGIAKSAETESDIPRGTIPELRDANLTSADALIGTPSYMPPELIAEDEAAPHPNMDVYSLGSILYESLCGRPPHIGTTNIQIFLSLTQSEPPPLPHSVPKELRDICARAMHKSPHVRHADASELCAALRGWLEQAKRREQAEKLVTEAQHGFIRDGSRSRRHLATQYREQAQFLLRKLNPWDALELKQPAHSLSTKAEALELEAEIKDADYESQLHSALALCPDLQLAHRLLAEHYLQMHKRAEQKNNATLAARAEQLLRSHDQGRHVSYLKGTGVCQFAIAEGRCSVGVYRYESEGHRLVATPHRELGGVDSGHLELERGSYVLKIEHPNYEPLLYPFVIRRNEMWNTTHPGTGKDVAIQLLTKGCLSADEVYVPAGWFEYGGDANASGALPSSRRWLDNYVIRKHPVTNREYLCFLNDLVERGLRETAMKYVPRAASARDGKAGEPAYAQDEQGHFTLTVDGEGDSWQLDWPVMLVDYYSANAYARWYSELTGQPWRLPLEAEWEKAARGVDGRYFPWGNKIDPTLCTMRGSRSGRPILTSIHKYGLDISPYGVCGMAGNVRDWCSDIYADATPQQGCRLTHSSMAPRINRGGHFDATESHVRLASRDWVLSKARGVITGFRLVRGFDEVDW